MATVTLIRKPQTLCDWCGRESNDQPLVTVTIVTPRGAFRDEICEPCYRAYEEPDEAA
jgi:hypothetical protein